MRVAIVSQGPSLLLHSPDWSAYDEVYGVNFAYEHVPCTAFMSLDCRTLPIYRNRLPKDIPLVKRLPIPRPAPKLRNTFPCLLHYVLVTHPGAEVDVYGVDMDGEPEVTTKVRYGQKRWKSEAAQIEVAMDNAPAPKTLNWLGRWSPGMPVGGR